MEEKARFSRRIPRSFPVNGAAVLYTEMAGSERFDRRKHACNVSAFLTRREEFQRKAIFWVSLRIDLPKSFRKIFGSDASRGQIGEFP
jgi:hypothetical protein